MTEREQKVRNVSVQRKTLLPSLLGAPFHNFLAKKKNVFFGISDQQAAPLLWPDAALDAIVKY